MSASCPHYDAKMPYAGPYSRPESLAKINGSTREARILKGVRADLTAHVGGKPSATQRVLIDRAAMLTLRIAMMDAKSGDGTLSERDSREYLAWTNTLTRLMRQLGMQGAAERPKSLAEHLASKAAA